MVHREWLTLRRAPNVLTWLTLTRMCSLLLMKTCSASLSEVTLVGFEGRSSFAGRGNGLVKNKSKEIKQGVPGMLRKLGHRILRFS